MSNKNINLLNNYISVDENKVENKEILLLGESLKSEEVEVLKKIGLDYSINKIEQKIHESNSIKQIKSIFNRNVYKGHMIKQLCNQYDLNLIRVNRYEGKIPLEIGKAIIEFRNENTIVQEKNENRTVKKSTIDLVTSKFFLLVTNKENSNMESYTLFYRENDGDYSKAQENDTFVEIHSSGKPFSKLREFYPLMYNEPTIICLVLLFISFVLTLFGVNLLILMTLISIFMIIGSFSVNHDEYYNKWNN